MNGVPHSIASRPLRVFISHAPADMIYARKLRNLLVQRANVEVFIAEDLSAGDEWQDKLGDAPSGVDVIVAILTPTSVHSSWVLHEIGAAWALGKLVIPIVTRRDALNNMPVSLETTEPIHLTDVENSENADEFVEAFQSRLEATHIA